MITIAMSTVIAASRRTVWRALTEPAELIRWDEHLLELLEEVPGYPAVGRHARWRYQLGDVPVVLQERPLEVREPSLLRCKAALGLFRFSVTHALAAEDPDRTKLALKLATGNQVPVVGGSIDRFDVRRVATEFVDTRLRALQKWCENHPQPAP